MGYRNLGCVALLAQTGCAYQPDGLIEDHYATFKARLPEQDKVFACSSYGCRAQTPFKFTEADIAELKSQMSSTATKSPKAEREAVRRTLAWMEHRVDRAVAVVGTSFESRVLQILEARVGTSLDHPVPYDWERRRPRLLYHADTWVQSLEDTPNVFGVKQTQSIRVRANIQRTFDNNYMKTPDWKLSTIEKSVPASDLWNVTCVDYFLKPNSFDMPEIGISVAGRLETFKSGGKDTSVHGELIRHFNKFPHAWDLYFLNQHKNNVKLPKNKPQFTSDEVRNSILKNYSDSLFDVLNDSVSYLHRTNLVRQVLMKEDG